MAHNMRPAAEFEHIRQKLIKLTIDGGYQEYNLNLTSLIHWNRYLAVVHDVRRECPLGGTVLDPACGFGPVTEMLTVLGYKAIGIDVPYPLNPVVHFQGLWAHLAGGFVLGDGERLPFPEGVFDVVAAHAAIEHVPNPNTFVQETFRVLKPGGILLAYELPKIHSFEYLLRNTRLHTHDYFLDKQGTHALMRGGVREC